MDGMHERKPMGVFDAIKDLLAAAAIGMIVAGVLAWSLPV